MAPIKFEEQLKEKLEKRSLQPSPDAWHTLENQLDAHERKNKSATFWWIGIAASFIGVILVATQFFKTPEDKVELPIVDGTKNASEQAKEPKHEKNDKVFVVDNDLKDSQDVNQNDASNVNKIKTPQPSVAQKVNVAVASKPTESVYASAKESSAETKIQTVPVKEMSIEDLKIQEVVAALIERQKTIGNVSEQEVDSLLKEAQRDIVKQRIYDENTKTVNANMLLEDVESELEESFRTKVFEALQSSFKTVKTAVAERNN